MNLFYRNSILAAVCLLCSTAFAQEALVTLSENPNAQPQPARRRVKNAPNTIVPLSLTPVPLAADDTLALPFVDDFVPTHPWPNPARWTTNGVYVNDHYALNVPTLGVATFDALDGTGRIYSHLGGSAAPADTLTSLPINLAGKNNVVLSFYYQPGGLGDMPEVPDKLTLEFYTENEGWKQVWSAVVNNADSLTEFYLNDTVAHSSGTLSSTFFYTAIDVVPAWCLSDFQFRFVNYVSLTPNVDAPGRASNADFWHLDFVYLNDNRTVTGSLEEVGMVSLQPHRNVRYSSVPAHHLATTSSSAMTLDSLTITYHNLWDNKKPVPVYYSIKPLYGAGTAPSIDNTQVIYDELDPEQRRYWNQQTYYTFSLTSDEHAAFEFTSYLDDGNDPSPSPLRKALRSNDTIKYVQEFHDYYAYDDGSAENGYGLYGNGSANGRVAVQFTSAITDTLRGVYLYFNLAKDSANAKPFDLTVWDAGYDNEGSPIPGEIIWQGKFTRPAFRDSLNKYVAYEFKEAPPLIHSNQIFYVGWVQTTENFLNIGFDANTPNPGKAFYSLKSFGNAWEASMYEQAGALMLRPIFYKSGTDFPDDHEEPVIPIPAAVPDKYLIYPNPATDWITVRNLTDEELGRVPARPLLEVFDLSGRKHRTGYTDAGMFSVSGLSAGLYIVRIIENGKIKTSQKIIVN